LSYTLFSEVLLVQWGIVAEQVIPIGFSQLAAHGCRTQAAGVDAGYQGSHAGAGDTVDRHAQFFEHFEDADVRRAARTATAEDQADARPGQFAGGRLRRSAAGKKKYPGGEGHAPQPDCHGRFEDACTHSNSLF
jgi:hypothetical protein